MHEVPAESVLVIGGSAGAVEGLMLLFEELGPLPEQTACLIVVHQAPGHLSHLPTLIARRGHAAALAIHGEHVMGGRVYIAPADNHLELRDGMLHVARGPRENNQRPSVDVLFRSASQSFGSAVVAVLLSGYLDCGTAGLISIKARGGVGVVQDPSDALAADMPQSAIRHAPVDYVVPMSEMAALVRRLLSELETSRAKPAQITHALLAMEGQQKGAPSPIVCPTCDGALTTTEVNRFEVYRCHVGHSFTVKRLEHHQAEAIENALWAAVRALEDGAAFSRRLSDRATNELRERFEERARSQLQQAAEIRKLLAMPSALAPGETL